MKQMKILFLAALLGAGLSLSAQNYTVDAKKSEIKWDGRKVTGSGHYGTVGVQEGTLEVADNKIKSARIVVDMNTIVNTDGENGGETPRLVGHLKSDDFFGVEKHPKAEFVMTGSGEFENNEAKVYGRLTIKGITQPVNFVAKRNGSVMTAALVVDRSLFDVRFGSGKFFDGLGDNMIKDEFTLDIKLVLK